MPFGVRGVSRLVVLLLALLFIFSYVATWLSITWINSWAAVYSPDRIISFHVEATPASDAICFQWYVHTIMLQINIMFAVNLALYLDMSLALMI